MHNDTTTALMEQLKGGCADDAEMRARMETFKDACQSATFMHQKHMSQKAEEFLAELRKTEPELTLVPLGDKNLTKFNQAVTMVLKHYRNELDGKIDDWENFNSYSIHNRHEVVEEILSEMRIKIQAKDQEVYKGERKLKSRVFILGAMAGAMGSSGTLARAMTTVCANPEALAEPFHQRLNDQYLKKHHRRNTYRGGKRGRR